MTAAIFDFPAAPQMFPCRRDEIVIAAHAVLRSAARHDDAILTEACVALQSWGDRMDHLEADAMLLAMRLRASRNARDAAATAKPAWTIAAWAGEVCAWLVFVGFAVAVIVVGAGL